MRSKTKFAVDKKTIVGLFEKAGIKGAENISPLGAGEYNSVYSVDAAGTPYAIKIAPLKSARILTYERQMMEQEVFFYSLMKDQAKIKVPKIYYSDFSGTDIPTGYFIMERLGGRQIDQADLSDAQKKEADRKLAAMVARMHTVKSDRFGYRQNGLHDNWYPALRSMVINLMEDSKNMGRRTRWGKRLLHYIDRNKTILEKVECSLINFDVWPANVFCDWEDQELQLAWIDPERCLWGDRIADLVCLDFLKMSLEKKSETVQWYNQVSDEPFVIGNEEKIRFAVMLGYLGLIMEVEKFARYSIFHLGYWRNVAVAKMLFTNSFKQLDKLTKY